MQLLNKETARHQQISFTQKCHLCKQVMELSEGDIIFGARWYHKSCWHTEKEQVMGVRQK
jgi:hypothetical protein